MNTTDTASFVIYTAYLLVGTSAFLVARMLVEEQESRMAQENLADLRDRKSSNPLVKLLRPIFTQYLVPMIRGKPFWDVRRKFFKRRLIAAGLGDELTADEFLSFKVLLILFFPLVLSFLKAGDFWDFPLYQILLSGIAGWFYPDFWVSGIITERQKSILRSLPFIVDLLALSTEAGLDFVGAIGKVVEKSKPSPLVDELGQLLKELKVGSSRQEGLREMAARISMQSVNSFVAILISADQMGASIGKILRQQSEQIRSERMLRAEKAGAAAASKVQIPTVLFIVPAVFIILIGPIVLQARGP